MLKTSPSQKSSNATEQVLCSEEKDKFHRWQFAKRLFDIVSLTPIDASCRLGLYGKWGEGKTTTLSFMTTFLESQGHIVVSVNPWSAKNISEFWLELISKLINKLESSDCGISKELIQKFKNRALFVKFLFPLKKLKGVDAGLSLGEKVLGLDRSALEELRKASEEKRIVFIIDDLDRTDPKIIPELLLSLREVLDIAGYTYILAFDQNIVADALKNHHTAWKNGYTFLEKIFDFIFYLPETTLIDRGRFAQELFSKECDFIPRENITDILSLLPTTPRKLKKMVRQLSTLRDEASRHKEDELKWVTILIFNMIKLESFECFNYIKNNPFPSSAYIAISEENKTKTRDEHINKILENSADALPEDKLRIVELLKFWLKQEFLMNSEVFRYQLQIDTHPHSVTWKEFDEFWLIYKVNPSIEKITDWLNEHSAKRLTTFADTRDELWRSTIIFWKERLAFAADSTTKEEHSSYTEESLIALNCLNIMYSTNMDQFTEIRSQSSFEEVYIEVIRRMPFKNNQADLDARLKEQTIIISWISLTEQDAVGIFPLINNHANFEFDNSEDLRKFVASCLEEIVPILVEKTIALFTQDGGINKLLSQTEFLAHRYVLLRKSPLFDDPTNYKKLLALLSESKNNMTIYYNVFSYFKMISYNLKDYRYISKEETIDIISIKTFMEPLWNAVISHQSQFRMMHNLCELRQRIISEYPECEDWLVIPEWLDKIENLAMKDFPTSTG